MTFEEFEWQVGKRAHNSTRVVKGLEMTVDRWGKNYHHLTLEATGNVGVSSLFDMWWAEFSKLMAGKVEIHVRQLPHYSSTRTLDHTGIAKHKITGRFTFYTIEETYGRGS